MSKLKLKFELIEVDHHTRKPLADCYRSVEIDAPELDETNLYVSLKELLSDFDREARRAEAAKRVNYDDYKSDSDYMNTLDKIADDYYTASVEVTGAVRKAYEIEGIYSDEGGLWGDDVLAVDAGEAKFQGAWIMAEESGSSMKENTQDSPEEALTNYLASVEDQEIVSATLVGPRKQDAFKALADLVAHARANGLDGDAVTDAEELIKTENGWTAYSIKDGIVYQDEQDSPEGPRP